MTMIVIIINFVNWHVSTGAVFVTVVCQCYCFMPSCMPMLLLYANVTVLCQCFCCMPMLLLYANVAVVCQCYCCMPMLLLYANVTVVCQCYLVLHRELLEGIADYERKIGLESFKTSFAQRAQLQPLQSGGREKLLQQVNIHLCSVFYYYNCCV